MSSEKYIGLDVHQATISVAAMDSQGKVVNGIHSGDQSLYASGVLRWIARQPVRDVPRAWYPSAIVAPFALLGPSPKEPNKPAVIWAFFERQRPI